MGGASEIECVPGLAPHQNGTRTGPLMLDVEKVQELAQLWADAEDERQAWVADSFRRLLQGEDPRRVFGLSDGRPGPSPRLRAVKRARNDLIRELAERFYDGQPTVRAKMLGADLARYLAMSWPRDREAGCPYGQCERRMLQYEVCAADPNRDPPTGYVRLLDIING
jgi:hypothetical protein